MLAANTLDWITGVGTGLGALAAAFAAWVALYVGVIQERKRRPVLALHRPEMDRELVVVGTTTGTDSAWLRCRVTNDESKSTAEDVEVQITSVTEIRPREGFPPMVPPALAGLSLAWSATEDRQSRAHIAPGGERLLDLAAVYKSQTASGLAPLVIQTSFMHSDADSAQALRTREVELRLVVVARNAEPTRYLLRLAYDGGWGSNVWDHLSVTLLEPIQVAR
jgi:hypothetical protein